MANHLRWLVVAAVVIAVIVAVVVWRAGDDGRSTGDSSQIFGEASVPVFSPGLAVGDALVRGTVFSEYTDWSCVFECLEAEGCHAEVQLVITYLSGGDELTVKLGGRLDAAKGEAMRLGRAQRPPIGVDGVKSVTLEVVSTYSPGAARPTPRI